MNIFADQEHRKTLPKRYAFFFHQACIFFINFSSRISFFEIPLFIRECTFFHQLFIQSRTFSHQCFIQPRNFFHQLFIHAPIQSPSSLHLQLPSCSSGQEIQPSSSPPCSLSFLCWSSSPSYTLRVSPSKHPSVGSHLPNPTGPAHPTHQTGPRVPPALPGGRPCPPAPSAQ